ncbi:MAG: hypothetical protein JW915_15605 [Chitinispirillaceae bacterium]|nr:hypothetical protein [Chitinispirillaceae bacterium]
MKVVLRVVFLISFTAVATLAAGFNWGEQVGSVLELVMLQRYNDAYRICDSVLAITPDDIDFHYVRLAVLQAQMSDYESYALDGQKCVSMAESVLVRVESGLAGKPPRDEVIRLNLIKATILGGVGMTRAKIGGMLTGIRDAKASYDLYRSLRNHSSLFPDVLYGIGLFDYYVGDNLRWIPGLGLQARRGIEYLYTASDSDSPFRNAAKISLLWILIEQGEFAAADSIAASMLRGYPEHSVFLQIQSRAVFGARQYQRAITLGGELIDRSLKRQPVNWCDVLSGYQLMAASWLKLNDKQKAFAVAEKGLSYRIPSDTLRIDWVRKHREHLKSIAETCQRR